MCLEREGKRGAGWVGRWVGRLSDLRDTLTVRLAHFRSHKTIHCRAQGIHKDVGRFALRDSLAWLERPFCFSTLERTGVWPEPVNGCGLEVGLE